MKLALLFGCAVALLIGCSRSAKTCAVCQRAECTGLTFSITLADGQVVETCCPRCGLRVVRQQTRPPRAVTATDYATGKQVDALAALYVVGSDVSHCAAMEVRRDAQGCCLYKGYDRCQPSTIAFAGRDEAEAFARKHGGKVSAWNELALR